MLTALEATTEAVIDGLADLGVALDEMPPEVEKHDAVAALAAAIRAFDQMYVLLNGDA